MFTEVKQTSKPLPQLVSEEIEKLIVLGEFKPGDRLPSEYELAQRLGRSRGKYLCWKKTAVEMGEFDYLYAEDICLEQLETFKEVTAG